jgi:hypothetical protein
LVHAFVKAVVETVIDSVHIEASRGDLDTALNIIVDISIRSTTKHTRYAMREKISTCLGCSRTLPLDERLMCVLNNPSSPGLVR